MKTPSSHLFDLLKSLSGPELRYIKIQLAGVDKGYTRLMAAVLAQENYDEEALKIENAAESFVKNLSVNKRYLRDLILTMLVRFTQKEQSEQILKQLNFAKTLFQRNFLKEAKKGLKKVKRLAVQMDAYEELLLIYNLERQLITAGNYELKQIQNLHKEIERTLAYIQNINDYWLFYTQLYQLQLRKSNKAELLEEIKSLVALPLFQKEEEAKTVRSKMYRFQARANYFFSNNEAEKAQNANLSFLKVLEGNANYRQRYSEAYFSTLNNFLIDSLMLQKYDDLDEGLAKLEQARTDPAFAKIKSLPSRIFRQTMMLQLNRAMATKEYAPAITLLPSLKKGLSEFDQQIAKQHKTALQYLAAYLLFKNKKYEDVISWTNTLLQSNSEANLSEYLNYTRWLDLLAHFELKNYRLVASLLEKTKKHVRQSRKLMKVELLLFKMLKKAVGFGDGKRVGAVLENGRTAIAELQKEERRFFQYLDLMDWLEKR